MHRARGGVNQKVMFDDKGGRGGLRKSDFCDKGEGGGVLGYPKVCMTSLKYSTLWFKLLNIFSVL